MGDVRAWWTDSLDVAGFTYMLSATGLFRRSEDGINGRLFMFSNEQ
jgi:hypothetical protein